MMQTDQCVQRGCFVQQLPEQGELLRAQTPADLARHGGVEQQNLPVRRTHRAHHGRATAEHALHGVEFVMVAREPGPGHAKSVEGIARAAIGLGARMIGDIPRRQQQIGFAGSRAHQIQHMPEARVGIHAKQGAARLLLEVRVGDLHDAQHATGRVEVQHRPAHEPAPTRARSGTRPSARQRESHSPSSRSCCNFSSRARPRLFGYG